jgi:VCBS repeat-containing protein
MRARPSPVAVARGLVIAFVVVVGLLGPVSPTRAEVVNPVFNPRQCQNWGHFGMWEVGPSSGAPKDDTIFRNSHEEWWLPLADGYDGSIVVPGSAIMSNDSNIVWDDDEDALLHNSVVLLYSPPQHVSHFELRADGSFTYRPETAYYGTDTFQYVWERTGYCSQPATVSITALSQAHMFDDFYTVDAFPPPLGPGGEIPVDSWPTPEAFSAGRACGFVSQCGVLMNDHNIDANDVTNVIFHGDVTAGSVRTTHGWVTPRGFGAFDYRPDDGFEGEDSINYHMPGAVGLNGSKDVARVEFFVRRSSAGDVIPVDDAFTTPEETALGIAPATLIANDRRTFSIGSVQGIDANFSRPPTVRTAHGTLAILWFQVSPFQWVINALTYTPDPNYNGQDWFTYLGRGTTTTGVPQAKTAFVFVDVTPTDDPPSALSDLLFTRYLTPLTFNPLVNDSDPDGDLDPSSVRILESDDAFVVNGDGTITFTPPADMASGSREIHYDVADLRGVTDDAFANVQVSPLVHDAYTVAEDTNLVTTAATGVRANDGGPTDPGFSAEIVTAPTHGTITLDPSGAFDYAPPADFAGTDTFTYRLAPKPATSLGGTATVTITVTNAADAPAVTLNARCAFSAELSIACSSNVDRRNVFEGQAVQLRGYIDDPDVGHSGSISVDWGDGSLVETFLYPCLESFGPCDETLWYTPTWGGAEAEIGRFFFDLSHVYTDDPATGPDGYTITVQPTDSTETSGAEVEALVSVLNVAPTMSLAPDCGGLESICLGFASDLTVMDGDPVTLLGRVQDPGTDPVQLNIDWGDGVGQLLPQNCLNGSACPTMSDHVGCNPTNIFLPPSCGYFRLQHTYAVAGTYEVTISAVDGDGGSDGPDTVSATVTRENVAPVATSDEYDVTEGGQLVVAAEDSVLANDTDADAGETLTATLLANPTKGTVSDFAADGTFTYTPGPGVSGDDSFTYEVCDSLDVCDSATVTVHIAMAPRAPSAGEDAYDATEDEALTVDAAEGVLANDSDANGDDISAELVDGPSKGTLSLQPDGSFVYDPNPNANGSDSFTYRASDGSLDSELATVSITIASVNDDPVADADAYEVVEGELLAVNGPGLLANDSDADGDSLSVTDVDDPDHDQEHSFGASGTFSYRSELGFSGTETLSYAIADGHGGTALGTITITVTPAARAPVAGDDTYDATEDQALTVDAAEGVLANDSDVNGDDISAELVDEPTKGDVSLGADGSFTYTPDTNANGEDSFTYRASDGTLESELATVTIDIAAVNDKPTADDDTYSVAEDGTQTVTAGNGVLAGDDDLDGDSLSAVLVDDVDHGTLSLNANGSFGYNPAANFNGSDSFTYRASDGALQSAVATVSITVGAVNDTPTISLVGGSCASDTEPVGKLVFVVSDIETDAGDLGLSATSANSRLVPASGLRWSGTGGNRTLSVTASTKQSGDVFVTATVSDGGQTANLVVNVVVGTAKNQTITGTNRSDLIFGLSGIDTISGGPSGDTSLDILCGGAGDDVVRGGAGADLLYGGTGADTLEGGDGADQLFGGGGVDTLRGDAGDDTLRGDGGGDRFAGGAGTDTYVDVTAAEGDTTLEAP